MSALEDSSFSRDELPSPRSLPRESSLEKARSRPGRGRARFLFKIYFETGDTWHGLKAERRLRIKQLRGGGSGDGSRSKCAGLIELLVPTAFTSFVARSQRITTDSSSVYRRARGKFEGERARIYIGGRDTNFSENIPSHRAR